MTELLISQVSTPAELEAVRDLLRDYWQAAGLAPEFQNFAEELRALPGPYVPPKGRLLLVRTGDSFAGTAALRPINDESCEVKRVYVRPQYRGMGIAKQLMHRLMDEARAAGYSDMYCDTMSTMTSAQRLYSDLGFARVGPYSADPTPGAVFFHFRLQTSSQPSSATKRVTEAGGNC